MTTCAILWLTLLFIGVSVLLSYLSGKYLVFLIIKVRNFFRILFSPFYTVFEEKSIKNHYSKVYKKPNTMLLGITRVCTFFSFIFIFVFVIRTYEAKPCSKKADKVAELIGVKIVHDSKSNMACNCMKMKMKF